MCVAVSRDGVTGGPWFRTNSLCAMRGQGWRKEALLFRLRFPAAGVSAVTRLRAPPPPPWYLHSDFDLKPGSVKSSFSSICDTLTLALAAKEQEKALYFYVCSSRISLYVKERWRCLCTHQKFWATASLFCTRDKAARRVFVVHRSVWYHHTVPLPRSTVLIITSPL